MNKKRLISALLVVMMVFTSLHLDNIDVKALTNEATGLVYSYDSTNNTAKVTGYSESTAQIVTGITIPEIVTKDGVSYTVNEIEKGALTADKCPKVTEVAVRGDNVIINDGAFGKASATGVSLGGFVVWCNKGSNAEKYAQSIGANIKYLNVKDIELKQPKNTWYTSCEPFKVTTVIKAKDTSVYSEDINFEIPQDCLKYLYFIGKDGKPTNTSTGKLVNNADGTTSVEVELQVLKTADMDVQSKEVTLTATSRGSKDTSMTFTICKATSSISQDIKVYELVKTYNPEKKITYINGIASGDDDAYIKVREVNPSELLENGYFDENTLYIDKDYIFTINGMVDEDNENDFIINTWQMDTVVKTESVLNKLFNYVLTDDMNSARTRKCVGIADEDGNILKDSFRYATSVGTTKVTLFSQNNTLSKVITIKVCSPATKLKMSFGGNAIENGQIVSGLVQTTYPLSHSFDPFDSTDTVTWKSSDPNVASINEGTNLYLKTAGNATITCEVNDSKSGKRTLAGSFDIISLAKVQYTELLFAKDSTMKETVTRCDIPTGGNYEITVCDGRNGKIYIADDTKTAANEPLTYTSENSQIATVSSTGVITAGAVAGKTRIIVKSESGKSNILEVNVYSPVQKIEGNTSIKVPMGQSRNFAYAFVPSTATEDMEWSSENESICVGEDYIDENGNRYVIVTGVKEGTAMLTGKTLQTGAAYRINVTVEKPVNTDKITMMSDLDNITIDEDGNTVYNVARSDTFYVKSVVSSNDSNNTTPNDLTKWMVEAGQNACNVTSASDDTITFTAKNTGKFKVTFVAYGKTPAGEDFEKISTFYVKVYVPSTALEIRANQNTSDQVNVELGSTIPVSAVLTPGDSTDKIRWKLDNDNVELSVDETSSSVSTILTANKVGTTMLTATSDSGKTDTIKINVIVAAENISFYQNGTLATKGYVPLKGQSVLSVCVSNEDVTTDKTFTWTTSGNSTYLELIPSADGKTCSIKGLAKGTQRITVTAPSGKSSSIDVEVVVPAEKIELNNTELSIFKGDAPVNVFATLSPSETTDIVYWSVDKEGIIKISNDFVNTTNAKKSITVQGIEAGQVTLTAKTVDGLTASMTINVSAREIQDTVIDDIPEQLYSGKEITPILTVKNGNNVLRLNTDYSVTYSDNVNVGTATVTVEGMGIYKGTTTKTFKINPRAISQTQNSAIQSVVYTGKENKPEFTLTDSATGTAVALKEGVDYTVKYENNTNAGTAMIKITGIGNYTGEKSISFQITQKNMATEADITVDEIADVTYNGTSVTPDVVVKDGSKTLEKTKDYNVVYVNNVNAGTATVNITGIGNYTGMLKAEFKINRKSLSKAKINQIANTTYNGNNIEVTSLNVTVGTRTLSMNSDYKVTFSNNKYPGKATVKLTGIGNYKSTATTSFIILPSAPSDAKMKSNTSNSVKLSWKKATKVTGYYIYRFDAKKNKYVKAATTSKNYVTIKKLASGTNSTFQIYSYVKVGSKVYKSLQYTTVYAGTRTKTPSIKKISSAMSAVNLELKALTGAEGYQIYCSTSKNGKYKLCATTTATSASVTGLKVKKTYYFKIRAYRKVNGKDYFSSYSAIKKIKIK